MLDNESAKRSALPDRWGRFIIVTIPRLVAEIMAEHDLEVDENPYVPPGTSPLGPVEISDDQGYRSKLGCFVLFGLVLIVVDLFGILLSVAGQYWPYYLDVVIVGLGAFACGAALGAYQSSKNNQRPWWLSCRWAIYGLGAILAIYGILSLFK